MKKLVTLLLVLTMLLAMFVPAFAENTITVSFENSDGRTYVGYQLLTLTTSLKTGEHHTAHDGTGHTADCYNYAYTVNAKYRVILQEETLANGRNELWVTTGKPATAAGVTDAQIIEYLSLQSSDEGDVYKTMRQVADRLYRAIQTGNIAADKVGLTGANNTVDQGYWMFADTTDLTGNKANSLVMVDTIGQESITINPKIALPTVEKKVKDIEDSEDDKIADNPWHDAADHDIGDNVPFKLTGTLPSNAQYFESYTMIFHDKLNSTLTLDESTYKVLMYDTKHKADVDTDLNDAKDVTNSFTLKTTGLTDGCTFEVVCNNVFEIEGVTKDTAFVVYYEATLNEHAVHGAAGNPNQVYLEFSNDPYGDSTGTTETDTVTVFTYKIIVNKTDSHGHALQGADFTLYKKNLAGEYVEIIRKVTEVDGTQFTWSGLDDGDYKLVESTVPAGYNKMSDLVFSISAAHSETDANEPALLSLDGGLLGTGEVNTGTITRAIINNTGAVLPETGAEGTMLLIGGGALLALLAAVFMITRKKMSVYED